MGVILQNIRNSIYKSPVRRIEYSNDLLIYFLQRDWLYNTERLKLIGIIYSYANR